MDCIKRKWNNFYIDLRAKKLSAKIDANVKGANRLKFTPDGKLVFITSLQSGDLTVYDAQLHKEVKKINIGSRRSRNFDGS
jgi:hypothetical protein